MIGQLIVVALGIWTMIAPAVLAMPKAASDVMRVVGPIVATFAACAAAEHLRAVRWWNLPLAIGLALSPLFVSFGSVAAIANAVLTACLIAALSLRRGPIHHRYGGGWRALFDPHEEEGA